MWKSSYKIFHFSRDHDIKRLREVVDGIKLLLSPIWCLGYSSSVAISFFHLSCDHAIKSSRDFKGRVLPLQVTAVPSLLAIRIAKEKIDVLYICHVTMLSKGHLTRYVGSSEGKLPPCQV